MKKDFASIKEELKQRGESTKYFTKAFYNAFADAVKAGKRISEAGGDDSYYVGKVRLYHHYDAIYASDFYNKNSCAYCEFLSIVC